MTPDQDRLLLVATQIYAAMLTYRHQKPDQHGDNDIQECIAHAKKLIKAVTEAC